MLTHLDDDGEQRILLTDFGIARDINDVNDVNDVTATTTAIRPELAALDPVLTVELSKRTESRFARCSDFARALTE
jgi:hypothetical protein